MQQSANKPLGRGGRLLMCLTLIASIASLAPATGLAENVDMNSAAQELGIHLLRPDSEFKPGNQYVATVRNPATLARLGLQSIRPGDRVVFRALKDNRIVVTSSEGDRTAPIELAESGQIVQAEEIRRLQLRGLETRELREPRQSGSGAARNAPSGLSTFGP